jgi:arylsulfatase A-like enzyme
VVFRSRRLAVAIGHRAAYEDIPGENLRAWLAQFGLAAWRTDFAAAPAELADLLQWRRWPAFDDDVWDLYDGNSDYSQAHNLAAHDHVVIDP